MKNDSFPTVGLNISEGREHLTGKTMQAFRYVYENYFDKADWFMKADDDTYVIWKTYATSCPERTRMLLFTLVIILKQLLNKDISVVGPVIH